MADILRLVSLFQTRFPLLFDFISSNFATIFPLLQRFFQGFTQGLSRQEFPTEQIVSALVNAFGPFSPYDSPSTIKPEKLNLVKTFKLLLPTPKQALLFVRTVSDDLPGEDDLDGEKIAPTSFDWCDFLTFSRGSLNQKLREVCVRFFQRQKVDGKMMLDQIIYSVIVRHDLSGSEHFEHYLSDPKYLRFALANSNSPFLFNAIFKLNVEQLEQVEKMGVTRFGIFKIVEACSCIQEKFPAPLEILDRALIATPSADLSEFFLRMGAKVKIEAFCQSNGTIDKFLVLLNHPSVEHLRIEDLEALLFAFENDYVKDGDLPQIQGPHRQSFGRSITSPESLIQRQTCMRQMCISRLKDLICPQEPEVLSVVSSTEEKGSDSSSFFLVGD
jgi:hypothetical protein